MIEMENSEQDKSVAESVSVAEPTAAWKPSKSRKRLFLVAIITVAIFASISGFFIISISSHQANNGITPLIIRHQQANNTAEPRNALPVPPNAIYSATYTANNSITPIQAESFLANLSVFNEVPSGLSHNISTCNMPEYSRSYFQTPSQNNSAILRTFNSTLPIIINITIYVGNNDTWWSEPSLGPCAADTEHLVNESSSHASTSVYWNNTVYIPILTELKGMQISELLVNGTYYQRGNSSLSLYIANMPYKNVLMRVDIWRITSPYDEEGVISESANIFAFLRSKYP